MFRDREERKSGTGKRNTKKVWWKYFRIFEEGRWNLGTRQSSVKTSMAVPGASRREFPLVHLFTRSIKKLSSHRRVAWFPSSPAESLTARNGIFRSIAIAGIHLSQLFRDKRSFVRERGSKDNENRSLPFSEKKSRDFAQFLKPRYQLRINQMRDHSEKSDGIFSQIESVFSSKNSAYRARGPPAPRVSIARLVNGVINCIYRFSSLGAAAKNSREEPGRRKIDGRSDDKPRGKIIRRLN